MNIERDFSFDAISWLYSRSIKILQLKCNRVTDDMAVKLGGIGSCLHWISIENRDKKNNKKY